MPSSAESGGGQAVKESRHRWIVENALPRRRGGTKKKKTLCLCVLVVYSFSHHKDTKKRKTLCLCDLVVFRAAGHAVEGQFIMDVGAEGHGSPLSTTKGIYSFLTTKTRRERKLCVLVPWWFFFTTKTRRHEEKQGLKLCVLVRNCLP